MKITLDFGHGGYDSGAVDGRDDNIYPDKYYTKESELVRKIGLKLASRLLKGNEVLLTRPNEIYIPLEDRTNLANNYNSDIFISLHANASANHNASGIEVLHYPDSGEGIRLASEVQNRLIHRSKANNRGIKPRDDIFVLEDTYMPSILIELGFITNDIEEAKLYNANYQKQLIEAIYEGIKNYG